MQESGARQRLEHSRGPVIETVERGEVRPLVAKTSPLERIADAQREFLEKRHVGNFVQIPPSLKG